MGENSCYTSLGKLLLLRVAVSASLATCVWAHQDSDDHDHHHHHHNHGRDRGDERSALVITILVSVRKAPYDDPVIRGTIIS